MNAPLIPQANPGAAFRSRRDALLKAAADVLDGGWYINGNRSGSLKSRLPRSAP